MQPAAAFEEIHPERCGVGDSAERLMEALGGPSGDRADAGEPAFAHGER
jgi:hypothetical protein